MIESLGQNDAGRNVFRCDRCGLRWTSAYPLGRNSHLCSAIGGAHGDAAHRIRAVMAAVEPLRARAAAAGPAASYDELLARVESCAACSRLTPDLCCSHWGRGCDRRQAWFSALCLRDCRHFQPLAKPPA